MMTRKEQFVAFRIIVLYLSIIAGYLLGLASQSWAKEQLKSLRASETILLEKE